MLNNIRPYCIDINTDRCPCELALTGHCIMCGHLQDQQDCNCNWQGICVLHELLWKGKNKIQQTGSCHANRGEYVCQIVSRQMLTENIVQLTLSVASELADELSEPGTFVFLRREHDPQYYNIPIGVMDVLDRQSMVLVVENVGPKSQHIVMEQQQLVVRGPYQNGLLGKPWVKNMAQGRVLIIAGGMGQPPAASIAKTLDKNYNKVTVILAPGAVGYNIIRPLLDSWGIDVVEVSSLRYTGLPLALDIVCQEDIELVVSCGPDVQHEAVIRGLNQRGLDIPLAVTNNAIMCCGEGVCGSCQRLTHDGQMVRMCKTQLEYKNLIEIRK